MLNIMIATNCTATQSLDAPPELTGVKLPRNLTAQQAAEEWATRLESYKGQKITPMQLYRGISFHSVVRMLTMVKEENAFIISIGQGLVRVREPITPYDLSVDPTHVHSLAKVITEEVFSPQLWWNSINVRRTGMEAPITDRFQQSGCDLLIVCCSGRFLDMVSEDLLVMVERGLGDKLRIVTTSIGGVPNQLKPYMIKYDKRLGITTIGNRNDTNQRAANHFLRLLANAPKDYVGGDVGEHQQLVDDALGVNHEVSEVKNMLSSGAQAALKILEQNKGKFANPDAAYTYIRRDAKIALTPGQFKNIWRTTEGKEEQSEPKGTKGAEAAMAAMTGILGRLSPVQSMSSVLEQEDQALELIDLFVGALREMQPDAVFGSADVYAWLGEYSKHAGVELPRVCEKIGNVARLIKANAARFGIEGVETGKQGGRSYRLANENKD